MNKIFIAALAAMLAAGCAAGNVKRSYSINASGYAEVTGAGEEEAKEEARRQAKENAVEAVSRFLEFRLPVSSQTSQVIKHGAVVTRSWVENRTAGATVAYEFDLYEFVGKNYDMKDYGAWELLGLENYYSDYARANKPVGIWIQQKINEEKNRSPFAYASLSLIPVYSGNFMLRKNVLGGFFTAAKAASLATLIFNEKQGAKVAAGVLLGLLTGADFYSVYEQSNGSVERLENLQDAVLSDLGVSFEFLAVKFN
jgi:hypothetical protein